MWSYVNHQAMNEVFMPLEIEIDANVRAELIKTIETEFATRILKEYERTCFELKKRGWNTGQIAEALNVSERKIKSFIRSHAQRSGEPNPLERYRPEGNVIDITHLVRRAHPQPTTPADGPA